MTSLLLDVSTHGVVEANGPRARTGIFRAIDETAKAMIQLNSMDIQLCAVRRPVHAIRYCAKDPILSKQTFSTSQMQRFASRHPRMEKFAALERAIRPAALSPCSHPSIFWSGHYHFLAASPERFLHKFVTIHDLLPLEHPEWFPAQESDILHSALKRINNEGWFVIFDTQHVRKKGALLANIPLHQSAVVSPGIDHKLFHPPTDSNAVHIAKKLVGVPSAAPYFLTLCTREPRKGLGTAVRAFIKAAQKHIIPEDSELVLVGSQGWGMQDIEAAIESSGHLRNRIRLPGFVPDSHLPALYAGALAFLFPSLAEGFGFPPLEAMASGCPVLSSNTSCMPEVLENAAIFLPPLDVDEWAQSLALLSSCASTRKKLLEEGTKQASKYNWKITASSLNNLFCIQ